MNQAYLDITATFGSNLKLYGDIDQGDMICFLRIAHF
jgi:hypothetical protein